MEFYEGKFSVEVFRERGAILHPIARVHVEHIAEVANFRPMNVPADHSVHAALARELNHRILVIRHVLHRGLGFEFDEGSERPATKSQRAPRAIDPHIQVENAVVHHRTNAIEQAIEMRETIELMAVNDQVTFAVRGRMHRAFHQPHRAETHAEKLFQKLVVISRDERDARFLAILTQQFLDQEIVFLRPIPFAAQLPAIDEITDDVEMLTFGIAQELEQLVDLRVFGAKMNVRNPQRAITHGLSRPTI
jgi:hypothetical protein